MSKQSNLRKPTVELQPGARPSRIRREPVSADHALARKLDRIDFSSREWEIRLAIGGILFFAIAIIAAVIDIGHLLSY